MKLKAYFNFITLTFNFYEKYHFYRFLKNFNSTLFKIMYLCYCNSIKHNGFWVVKLNFKVPIFNT